MIYENSARNAQRNEAELPMLDEQLSQAESFLVDRLGPRRPRIGMILGSGLGTLADEIDDAVYIPYTEVPFMNMSTTITHAGRFVCGEFAGENVIAMQGRLHGYEGNTSIEVAYPVWLMHRLGVETLIVTNAVGAINETYRVGDFCVITDHINFTGRNPIVGRKQNDIAPRFFSMLDAYDQTLRELALRVAEEEDVTVREGVYLGLLGPSFETPAEICMFRAWGADTVAMSVVEEAIAARHVGMRVMGMSLVTNMACGVEGASPNGDEMFDVAEQRRDDFVGLMAGIVRGSGA